jgi:hypothetical protein
VLERVQCFSSKKKIYWEYVEKETNKRENGTAMRKTLGYLLSPPPN